MIALKVEKIGDQVAVVLNKEAMQLLNVEVGSVLHVAPARDGVLSVTTQEVWVEDHHARGKAFLKRYNRSFQRFEG